MGYRSDGTVYIDTRIDSKGFGKGVNTMQKQVGGLSSAIGKLGAVIATTFAVGKIVQFGNEAIELGSDLQEVQNVVDVTFETMNKKVDEFARGAAEAAGLSETMAKRYVGTFGAMAKAFGFAENESFDMATALTQLAGDVASFYNITQDEAYTKLKSVFTGETESLKDLGVVMTQSALDSFAMAKGYGKTTAAMEENEKVALRYAFVVDKLNAASGDFERTSGGWANQMRILSLNFDTFKANVGQALINVFTPLLRVINTLVSRLANMSQYFVAFSELIVGKQTSSGGGSPGESLVEVADGYESIADAAEDATKAQKGYISNLDELNNYTSGSGADSSLEDSSLGDLGGVTDSTLQDIKDSAGLVEDLEQKFPRLVAILKKIANKVKEIFADFSIGDFFEAGKDISELTTIIFDRIAEAIDEVNWEEIGNKIGEFIKGVDWTSILSGVANIIFEAIEGALELWKGSFDTAPVETAIVTALAAMKFAGLKINVPATIGITIVALAPDIGKKIAEAIGIDKTILGDPLEEFDYKYFFDKLSEGFTNEAGNIDLEKGFAFIGDAFEAEMDMLRELLNKWFGQYISETFKKNWGGIIEFSSSSWKKFIEFIKERLNDLISFINLLLTKLADGINGMIDLLNGLKFDVPDWVPGLGGKSFGLGIEKIVAPQIPYLATGAVIPPNAPFMAMLGDQRNGNNIEAPEDLIRKIVREESGTDAETKALLSEIAQNTRETADKDLTIGDREIARANARGQRSMGYTLVTEG